MDPSLVTTCISPRRDKRFYISDGTHVFRVENTFYKLHYSTLSTHLPGIRSLEFGLKGGVDDTNAIVLSGISSNDFWHALTLLYPQRILYPHMLSSIEQWASVLRVARFYSAKDMTELAMQKLRELDDAYWLPLSCTEICVDPVTKIKLALEFPGDEEFERFRVSGYVEICHSAITRDRRGPDEVPITMEQGQRLGMTEVFSIWRVYNLFIVQERIVDRERLRASVAAFLYPGVRSNATRSMS